MVRAWMWCSLACWLFRGPGQQLAEVVQRFGLAEPCVEFAEQVQGLLVAGGGGPVVSGQPL
jgi:hypothetical protein